VPGGTNKQMLSGFCESGLLLILAEVSAHSELIVNGLCTFVFF